MLINILLLLFCYWFGVWGVFNLLLLPHQISLLKGGNKSGIFFWLAGILPLALIVYYLNQYFAIFVLIQILIVFVPTRKLQLHRNLLSDIIFQQSMLYLLYSILSFIESPLHLLYFVLCVAISHLPIFLLKHVRLEGKLIILTILPLAATIIYFTFRHLLSSTSLLISLTIHYCFYFILMQIPKVKGIGIII